MDQIKNDKDRGGLERIAERLGSCGARAVCFEIFDSLLVRPLGKETDLYRLLCRPFQKRSEAHISFEALRLKAEEAARDRRTLRGQKAGPSLKAIYEAMSRDLFLDRSLTEEMYHEETNLLSLLSQPRRSGKYLYEEARKQGLCILAATDSSYEEDDLTALLREKGYGEIASVLKLPEDCGSAGEAESTGWSLPEPLKRLGLLPGEILFVGSERFLRCLPLPEQQKALLPSPMEAYETHGCAHQAEKICHDLTDWEKARAETGISIMRAMAANRYFDDPFRPITPGSDYNRDPYFVGYGALGMEIVALIRWLCDNIRRDGIKKMAFLSRDGYLPMKTYEKLRQYRPELPESVYLHVSRLSLLPVMVRESIDLFDLPIDITRHTPKSVLKLLAFCSREGLDSENARTALYQACGKAREKALEMPPGQLQETESGAADENGCGNGKNSYEDWLQSPFTKASFRRFIAAFIRHGYDKKAHEASRKRIRDYFQADPSRVLDGNTAIFDMGYSGRIAQAIIEATGQPLKVYYFHADGRTHFLCERQQNFTIRSFFDFSPYMESTMREYAYLACAPSCIGYDETLAPVFDQGPSEHYADTALALQKGALDLASDFYRLFWDYEKEAAFRPHNAAMPFEAFIRYYSLADREMYDQVEIDDELWGGRRNINLSSLMAARRRKIPPFARRNDEEY